jgi:hypothetical protein
LGREAIVTVPKDVLEVWRGSVNEFRDPHLLGSVDGVKIIEVQGANQFSLVQQETNQWRVQPQDFPADSDYVKEMLANLAGMRIVEFAKDIVTPMDLPNYGLAAPQLRFILKTGPRTNDVLAQLDFGTNVNNRVFVRRLDESSVYAVQKKDFDPLPATAVQARKRQIWDFSENEVAQVTIRQDGKVRQLVRKGAHEWLLAPGSQGSIHELAVEESVRPLCRLEAATWVARGETNRAAYGFTENGHQVTLELKNGDKQTVSFGAPTGSDTAFAGVNLDGDFWIFQFPPGYYRFIATYLTIPANSL